LGDNHALGRAGEDLAARFLEACGYTLLARRWRRPGGEIDLIVARDGRVVFVEVKTRGPRALAAPEGGMRGRQRSCLRRLARRWLAENPERLGGECRCDVVAIEFGGEGRGLTLRHFADAF
jgi:putative endonuclease